MNLKSWIVAFATVCLFGACENAKNVVYFQDLSFEKQLAASQALVSNRLQVGDKLNIVISSSLTPEVAIRYNLPLSAARVGATSVARNDHNVLPYYVDEKGNIELPELGKLRVGGLTRNEVRETIQKMILERNLLRDVVVTVEVLNHYVYVLGDVRNPGRISLERDNITLLEALAQVGDMNITGQRHAVTVIRTEQGKQRSYMVNMMHADSLISSPVYQLQPGDCVYVAPNQMKQNESRAIGNTWVTPSVYISLGSFVLSSAILVSNLLRK